MSAPVLTTYTQKFRRFSFRTHQSSQRAFSHSYQAFVYTSLSKSKSTVYRLEGMVLEGVISWVGRFAFGLVDCREQEIVLYRHALSGYTLENQEKIDS